MNQTILFKAPGRRSTSPVVILNGLLLSPKSPTALERISRTLSRAWNWCRCNCTPRRVLRALFCEKVSFAVASIGVSAMWWHNIAIDDVIAAQEAVATDCLYMMPWGIVWAVRATFMSMPKEGGEA